MVKYTVAASVALLQVAMFTQTSVALPIEQYPEGVESRAISNPSEQQLAERHYMELEERFSFGKALLGGGALALVGLGAYQLGKKHGQANQNQQNGQPPAGAPPVENPQKTIEAPPPAGGSERRDLSELDARDWEDIAKRYFDDDLLDRRGAAPYGQADGSQPHPKGGRDLSDLNERDSDAYEKRSFDEFEERDWDDYEMEARGLDFDELDELD